MRRTKEEAEVTRANLLSAALKLFGENGVTATRLEDIARAAGVSRGALYWHFDGKGDIIIELLKTRTDSFFHVLDEALGVAGDPLDRISGALNSLMRHHENDVVFRDAMMLEFERAILDDRDNRFHAYLKQTTERYVKVFSAIIEEGKQYGSIRDDFPTPYLLQFLGALTTGVFMEYRLLSSGNALTPGVNRDAVIKLAIEALKA